MSTQWQLHRDGQTWQGLSSEQLQKMAADGRLLPDDYLWRPGMDDWIEARSVPRLFPASPPPARTSHADRVRPAAVPDAGGKRRSTRRPKRRRSNIPTIVGSIAAVCCALIAVVIIIIALSVHGNVEAPAPVVTTELATALRHAENDLTAGRYDAATQQYQTVINDIRLSGTDDADAQELLALAERGLVRAHEAEQRFAQYAALMDMAEQNMLQGNTQAALGVYRRLLDQLDSQDAPLDRQLMAMRQRAQHAYQSHQQQSHDQANAASEPAQDHEQVHVDDPFALDSPPQPVAQPPRRDPVMADAVRARDEGAAASQPTGSSLPQARLSGNWQLVDDRGLIRSLRPGITEWPVVDALAEWEQVQTQRALPDFEARQFGPLLEHYEARLDEQPFNPEMFGQAMLQRFMARPVTLRFLVDRVLPLVQDTRTLEEGEEKLVMVMGRLAWETRPRYSREQRQRQVEIRQEYQSRMRAIENLKANRPMIVIERTALFVRTRPAEPREDRNAYPDRFYERDLEETEQWRQQQQDELNEQLRRNLPSHRVFAIMPESRAQQMTPGEYVNFDGIIWRVAATPTEDTDVPYLSTELLVYDAAMDEILPGLWIGSELPLDLGF